jgi:hypothetical protein
MGLPASYDIEHYRGDTFRSPQFSWATGERLEDGSVDPGSITPVDMTGGSLRAQIRESTDLGATIIDELTITDFVPASGSFFLTLTAAETAAAPWAEAFYDVEFTSGAGVVTTLYKGKFSLGPDVSREEV